MHTWLMITTYSDIFIKYKSRHTHTYIPHPQHTYKNMVTICVHLVCMSYHRPPGNVEVR